MGEMSRLLATTEWHGSPISGSTDHSTAKMYDNLADSFKSSDGVKREDSTHLGEKQFQEYNYEGGSTNSSQTSTLTTVQN